MTASKVKGLTELRRELKDGTRVIQYRVRINRGGHKIDKLYNEDELEEAIELINACKSITGKSKVKLLEEQKKKQNEMIGDYLRNPPLSFYINKYIEDWVEPKFENYTKLTAEGKFKLRNRGSILSAYDRIKNIELTERADEKWELSEAIFASVFEKKKKLGDFKPSQITEIEMNEFIRALLKQGLRPLSVLRYITHLSNVYKKLRHLDPNLRTLANPCHLYDKDLLKQDGNLIRKIPFRLSDEERQKLFEELDKYPNPEFKQIILLMLYCGLRRSEVVLLKWSQVRENYLYLQFTKSGNPRKVYLIPQAKELLNSIPRGKKDRLFSYTVIGFSGSLKKFLERLGMEQTGSHIFRKESLSVFIEMIGAENSMFIAEFLGRASIRKVEEEIEAQEEPDGISSQRQLQKMMGHSNSKVGFDHYFSFKKK